MVDKSVIRWGGTRNFKDLWRRQGWWDRTGSTVVLVTEVDLGNAKRNVFGRKRSLLYCTVCLHRVTIPTVFFTSAFLAYELFKD